MAEIKIEKKKPVWPWILAALVIAALIYFLFFYDNNAEQDTTVIQETEGADSMTGVTGNEADTTRQNTNSEVAAYVDFMDSNKQNMGLDHEFTNEAFQKLITATEAKAADINYDITRDISQVREHAEKITNDPYETTHANSISKAATILAATLQGMQQKAYPHLSDEANEVKEAANAIDPGKLTLDQKDKVKSFFDNASELLEDMNN